jgi:hypothetical protein
LKEVCRIGEVWTILVRGIEGGLEDWRRGLDYLCDDTRQLLTLYITDLTG